MHKIILGVFLILTATNLFGQVKFGNMKCDSFQVLVDTSRALIFKKDKCTVYDKSIKKSLIRPTTDALIYLDEQDAFIQINADQFTLLYVKGENEIFRTSSSKASTLKFSDPDNEQLDGLVLFNGMHLNYKTGEVDISENLIDKFYPQAQLNLVRNKDGTICFNYWKKPLVGFIDADNAELVDTGFTMSGVYRLNDRKWLVPQVYEKCTAVDGKFICLVRDNIIPVMTAAYEPWYYNTYSYTYFDENEGVFRPEQANIQANDEIDYATFFKVDSVTKILDSSYFITHKNKQQGLVRFQLFDPYELSTLKMRYLKILDPVHDFVLYNMDYGFFMTYNQREAEPISFYSFMEDEVNPVKLGAAKETFFWGADGTGGVTIHKDKERFYWPEFLKPDSLRESINYESKIEFNNNYFGGLTCAGIEILNDSLLLIIDYKNDSTDLNAEPLISMEYPEEDSVYFNETEGMWYAVYPPDFLGYERSGVYNYRQGNWQTLPTKRTIQVAGPTVLTTTIGREFEHGNTIRTNYFSLQTNEQYHFENWSFEIKNPSVEEITRSLIEVINPKQRYDFPKNSIYRENYGYQVGNYTFEGEFFYVQDENGKWAIYRPVLFANNLTLRPFSKTKEFVHYNPSFDYFVWLDNDSIYLEKGPYSFAVSQENGEIIIDFIDSYDGDDYRIQSIDANDTISEQTYMYESIEGTHSYVSYKIENGHFLLNEEQNYDNIEMYFNDVEDYLIEFDNNITYRNFQSETSAIWRKENGNWVKKTPYYASVKALPFGYLVKTGGSEELIDAYTAETAKIPANYLVLDTNFKAMSYYDFYNFEFARIHEFGLELSDAQGSFLLDNSGKIITTSGWSDFELEDGKIKAIKYKEMEEEDFWEIDMDELIEKVAYFDF